MIYGILFYGIVGGIVFLIVWMKRRRTANFYKLIVAADRGEKGAREALYKAMDKMGINENYHVIREKMYRRLAEQGDTFAMVQLGQSIQNENPAEAYALFCTAADCGDTSAMRALGDGFDEYRNNPHHGLKGFGYDPVISFQWYKKAATLGDAEAMYWVASAYSLGEGVDANETLAYQWALQGSNRGNTSCMQFLSDHYYSSPRSPYYNVGQAIALLEKVILTGDPYGYEQATRSLGYIFDGRNTQYRNPKKAAYCFTLSAFASGNGNFELVYKTGYPVSQRELSCWREDALALRYRPNDC